MPKALTDEQKDQMRSSLLEAGRQAFAQFGIRKTTVDDLAKLAGMAKGSFYRHFASKEELYVSIFKEDIPALISRMHAESFGSTSCVREALVRLMKSLMKELKENPLARVVLDSPEEIKHLLAASEFNALIEIIAASYAPILEEIRVAQSRGDIRGDNPAQVLYSLGMVKFLVMNRSAIPAHMYDAVVDFYPEALAAGLTIKEAS